MVHVDLIFDDESAFLWWYFFKNVTEIRVNTHMAKNTHMAVNINIF